MKSMTRFALLANVVAAAAVFGCVRGGEYGAGGLLPAGYIIDEYYVPSYSYEVVEYGYGGYDYYYDDGYYPYIEEVYEPYYVEDGGYYYDEPVYIEDDSGYYVDDDYAFDEDAYYDDGYYADDEFYDWYYGP